MLQWFVLERIRLLQNMPRPPSSSMCSMWEEVIIVKVCVIHHSFLCRPRVLYCEAKSVRSASKNIHSLGTILQPRRACHTKNPAQEGRPPRSSRRNLNCCNPLCHELPEQQHSDNTAKKVRAGGTSGIHRSHGPTYVSAIRHTRRAFKVIVRPVEPCQTMWRLQDDPKASNASLLSHRDGGAGLGRRVGLRRLCERPGDVDRIQ
jgi:hypothetical protein